MQNPNVTITVAYGSENFVFELDGTELSEAYRPDGKPGHRYLGNASKDFIANEVERGLVAMFAERSLH